MKVDANTVYLASTDANGVLCVEHVAPGNDVNGMAMVAHQYPDVIYFTVEAPANHVSFYASQDVADDRSGALSTWSVYREEYAPDDPDNPIDDLTFLVATVADEDTAYALANHLYERNI